MANDYNLACWEGPGQPLTWRYVSTTRQTTTAGTDFWLTCEGGKVNTILLDGIEYQVTLYWGPNGKLVLEYCVNRGSWTRFIYDGKRGLADIGPPDPVDDAHETCVGNFDSLGHYHIFYNHHNEALNYRITTLPINDPAFAGALTSETAITGLDSVTYPIPFRDPLDNLWLCTGQGASTADRDEHLLKLTTPGSSPVWSAPTGTGTNGIFAQGQTDNQGIYMLCPAFTPDWDGAGNGYMYLAGTWKEDPGSNTLHSPFVVRYDGITFTKTTGAQTVPLRYNNVEILDASGTGNNFSSGATVTCDSQGRPHLCWLKGATNCAIIHAYHDGTSWHLNTVITGVGVNAFIMPGTLVAWPDDTISILIRDESNGHIMAYSSLPNDYTDWTTIDELTNVDTGAEFTASGMDGVACCPDQWGIRNKNRVEFALPLATTKPFLLENLQAHYDLQDIEESRARSFGKRLTNNATVTFAAGKIGNAADFETGSSTSQNLSIASNQIIPTTGSMTILGVFNPESVGAALRGVCGSWITTGGQRAIAVNINTTPRLEAIISKAGTAADLTLTDTTVISTGTWYGFILVVDAPNNQVRLRVGTGSTLAAAISGAHTADGVTGDHVFQSSEAFRVGRGSSNVAANFMDGLVDELAVLWGVPTADQESAWWNAGNILPIDKFGMIAPDISSHDPTESVDIDPGDTTVATLSFYGDLYQVSVALTGDDASLFNIVDNDNGTVTVEFDSPATSGTYNFTAQISNPANASTPTEVEFTVNVAGGLKQFLLTDANQ